MSSAIDLKQRSSSAEMVTGNTDHSRRGLCGAAIYKPASLSASDLQMFDFDFRRVNNHLSDIGYSASTVNVHRGRFVLQRVQGLEQLRSQIVDRIH
jgi:hypothetical protein